MWTNRKSEQGPFDIIGDIHGCFAELKLLLEKMGYGIQEDRDGRFTTQAPDNRQVVFVGDLKSKSPVIRRRPP